MSLKKLYEKRAAKIESSRKFLDEISALEAPSAEQMATVAANRKEVETLSALIADAEAVEAAAGAAAPAAANFPEDAKIHVGKDLEAEKPFASFGEQLMAIQAASNPERPSVDKRLLRINGAATGSNSGVASDGGFLIQHDFTSTIVSQAYESGEIASRVTRIPIGANANGLKMNTIDETSRVTGSRLGGIQVYWEGEAETVTPKKPKLGQLELNLKKLMGFWYATDELLNDQTALSAIATKGFQDEITWMVENAILAGTGQGQPKGIFNSAAAVSVAKETGQAADTIVAKNILKMWSRMPARLRRNAVWLINQDIEPELFSLQMPIGTGGVPLYLPPNGLSESPFSTLMGRPIIPVEQAPTLGDTGDIGLYDLSQYLMIDKGGVKQDVSIHVRFLYDETCFRFVYRADGQSLWKSAVTPAKGSNTLSPFVKLDARA